MVLVDYQQRTGRWSDQLAAHRTAMDGARRHGDRLGEGDFYERALQISREVDGNPRTAELEERLSKL